jgi:hypothetical protein
MVTNRKLSVGETLAIDAIMKQINIIATFIAIDFSVFFIDNRYE